MLPQVAADATSANCSSARPTPRILDHRHVILLHDLGWSEGIFSSPWSTARAAASPPAQTRGHPLPADKAVKLILQALDGLAYAHQVAVSAVPLADGAGSARGLVHRDIKPQNLFLPEWARPPRPKVGDYGLAKAFDVAGPERPDRTGETAGTPALHAAPAGDRLQVRPTRG